MLQAEPLQAGYKLIDGNDPAAAAAINDDIRLGNAYADALHACEAAAMHVGKEQRCSLTVKAPTGR